jgi:hypothetical protein
MFIINYIAQYITKYLINMLYLTIALEVICGYKRELYIKKCK